MDIRPSEQRGRDGELAGAVVVDRNVLEWRLDPTSPHPIPEAAGPDFHPQGRPTPSSEMKARIEAPTDIGVQPG